jgi:hypothetical protein
MSDAVPASQQAQLVLQLFSEIEEQDRVSVAAALLKPEPEQRLRPAQGPSASSGVSTLKAQTRQARHALGNELFGPSTVGRED